MIRFPQRGASSTEHDMPLSPDADPDQAPRMVRYFPDDAPDPDRLPRVLGRAQALALGFSRNAIEHRLRTERWRLVLPHTFLTSDVLTWPDQQRAALTYAGDRALLSAAAALVDAGLRSVTRPETVLVLVPFHSAARTRLWVRVRRTHRMPPPAAYPGPARADFARAVADLALERARPDDVRALVTQAIRAHVCTADELAVQLAEGPRRNSRNLRMAIDEVRGGAWSAPEGRAARLLRAADVPAFRQNARIDLPTGGHLVVDFLWRALRAVLEIDSLEHNFLTPAQREATDERHITLMKAGYAVAHRTPWVITQRPDSFVRGIEGWLAARARELRA